MKCEFCEKAALEGMQTCEDCGKGYLQDLTSSLQYGFSKEYDFAREILVKYATLGDFTKEEWDIIFWVVEPLWGREECDAAHLQGGTFYEEGIERDLDAIYEEEKKTYQEKLNLAFPILKRMFSKSRFFVDAKNQCKESKINYNVFCLTLFRTICLSLNLY